MLHEHGFQTSAIDYPGACCRVPLHMHIEPASILSAFFPYTPLTVAPTHPPQAPAAVTDLNDSATYKTPTVFQRGGSNFWRSMTNTYGAVWELNGVPPPPLHMRCVLAAPRLVPAVSNKACQRLALLQLLHNQYDTLTCKRLLCNRPHAMSPAAANPWCTCMKHAASPNQQVLRFARKGSLKRLTALTHICTIHRCATLTVHMYNPCRVTNARGQTIVIANAIHTAGLLGVRVLGALLMVFACLSWGVVNAGCCDDTPREHTRYACWVG